MSLFSFLAHTLRAMGHEEAAADVERGGGGGGAKKRPYELEDDEAPRVAPAQAAAVTHGEHDGGHGGGGHAAGAGGCGGAAGGAESGSSGGAGGDHGAGAGGGSGSGASESASAPGVGSASGEQEERAKPPAEPKPEPSLADDPTAGLHSERLVERLHRDAAKGASSTAADSEIHRLADQARGGPSLDEKLFPAHVLEQFTARGSIHLDTSPAAQAGRIAALGGAIPDWARGDPQHDPSLIRSAERTAAPERTAAGAGAAPHSAPAAASSSAPAAAHAGAAAPARER